MRIALQALLNRQAQTLHAAAHVSVAGGDNGQRNASRTAGHFLQPVVEFGGEIAVQKLGLPGQRNAPQKMRIALIEGTVLRDLGLIDAEVGWPNRIGGGELWM